MGLGLKKGQIIYAALLFVLNLFLCLGLPLLSTLTRSGVFVAYLIQYGLEILRLLPPFLMLGAAAEALRPGSFRGALPYFIYYAAINLILQIPSAALAAKDEVYYTFGALLIGYLGNSLFSSACFLLLLLLGYLVFIRQKVRITAERFFGFSDSGARVIALCVVLHVVYSLIREGIDFYCYLYVDPGKMYPSGGDIGDFIFRLVFRLALAVPLFAAARKMQILLQKEEKN